MLQRKRKKKEKAGNAAGFDDYGQPNLKQT